MKSLRTLLKLAKSELETLRRALAAASARLRRADERMAAHEREVEWERQLAGQDYESARAFTAYVLLAAQQNGALEAERRSIAKEIDELRTLVAAAHVEARKFERLIELDEVRERMKRSKREDAELDEMATLRAGRQQQV
jgi:flagellar export protein FliJ